MLRLPGTSDSACTLATHYHSEKTRKFLYTVRTDLGVLTNNSFAVIIIISCLTRHQHLLLVAYEGIGHLCSKCCEAQ